MRFVLGNRFMLHVGGTEVHLVTVSEALIRMGHESVIYSPELGPYSDYARRRGLDVVGELRNLPDECDVVLAQDRIVAYDLAERYPDALFLFRICGDVFDFQLPPQVEGLVDLTVVLSERYARVANTCAVKAPLLRLRIPVDLDRLVSIGPIRERPRRAVMLGNYGDRYELVRAAWGSQGIEVGQIGLVKDAKQSYEVASAVADADIVVAKSRAALEAMACARAVYVFDTFGGDGWVTPESYPLLEADNFAGQATERTIVESDLQRDLHDYDPRMGVANRDLAAQYHAAHDHVVELLAAIAAIRPPPVRPPTPLSELSRMTALQYSWEQIARTHQATSTQFYERMVEAEHELADARAAKASAEAETVALRGQVDAMRATRAWRLASRYWRLKQRARRPAEP